VQKREKVVSGEEEKKARQAQRSHAVTAWAEGGGGEEAKEGSGGEQEARRPLRGGLGDSAAGA